MISRIFPTAFAASVALGWTTLTASAALHLPQMPSGVDEGTVLLGELNCTACHSAEPAAAARLSARGAPKFGAGPHLSSAWTRTWLLDPLKEKPGTAMPSVLHGVPESERPAVAAALTQYLASLNGTNGPVGLGADPTRVEKGRRLFHSVGCVACHAPETAPAEGAPDALKRAQAEAVPLGDLARKYHAGDLARFLVDPTAHRPGGRMPALNLSASEAEDLAIYLVRDQLAALDSADRGPKRTSGLKYELFEGDGSRLDDFLKGNPKSTGVAATPDIGMPHPGNNWAVRYSGFLEIAEEGDHRFWIRSDDGSRVVIDGKPVVDNDGVHPASEKSGKIALKPGLHSIEVSFFQGGGETEFSLRWARPGQKREPIPAQVLSHDGRPLLPVGDTGLAYDPVQFAEGRRHFAALNCVACHAVTDPAGPLPAAKPAKPLAELAGKSDAGCLADAPSGGAPRFDLSPAQRQALRRTLARVADLSKPLAPADDIRLTMARLNCYACHSRDGEGGPVATGRAEWFTVVGEADLGDEGRIPPHLTGVGAKLKESALKEILGGGAKVRPYMAARMPVFGAESLRLATVFKKVDPRPDAQAVPAFTATDAKSGWKLVGRDGLGCVSCHTFTTYGSLGIPALSLDRMASRLEWDWFRRYLPDPAALRPGTRMPTFWPEGQAVNKAVLGGNTDAQIRALYAYLSDGAKAEVPSGLIRGRKELVVDDEAVIYRNFIEGAGARAIGVGYPGHANLAFDAQNVRLALIWQGPFIDMARHSTDRGQGYEPPLGDHRIVLPDGPAFAVLALADAPWPTADATPSRFLGYSLDSRQQPTFRYRIAGVEIGETPMPKPGPIDMTLVRTFRFNGKPSGPLWLRLAKGPIRTAGPSFTLENGLRITVRGAEAVVAGDELRVPVDTSRELTVEMTW